MERPTGGGAAVEEAVPPVSATPFGRAPRVTIGLPVFNGERFLGPTLDAIEAQTFRDYELVVCDNASTDGTREICEARASRDPRVRYVRNATNIGGDRNWNRAFELGRGEYFLGIGYDDLLHPEYLAKTVRVLEEDPDAVFCHARAHRIDEEGRVTGEYPPHRFSASRRPSDRFYDAIRPETGIVLCLGLIRSPVLRRTPLLRPHPFSDSFLQAEMALRGHFREVPEFLFSRRTHARLTSIYDRGAWCTPESRARVLFPHWRRLGEYLRVVGRVPMPGRERVRCLGMIARYAGRARLGRNLLRDLWMAVRQTVRRSALGERVAARRRSGPAR